MDKRIIFACAGAGKTTYIINNMDTEKKYLIITYTNANYQNLYNRIFEKNNQKWPDNIYLVKYFTFLYKFCYSPFLADDIKAKGINFNPNLNKFAKKTHIDYYMDKQNNLYSNRIVALCEYENILDKINKRIKQYFDVIVVDEVQDFGGRDFNLLLELIKNDIGVLLVGDFFQHTYDTSKDGNININLYKDINTYEKKFSNIGLIIDKNTLIKSWRCSENVCKYIRENIGIDIYSNRDIINDNTEIIEITELKAINDILSNPNIIKLHYKNSNKYGCNHRNWADTKGEDKYVDVCVLLNKKTYEYYKKDKLEELPTETKNKLYVAITRARGNVYLINEIYAKVNYQ